MSTKVTVEDLCNQLTKLMEARNMTTQLETCSSYYLKDVRKLQERLDKNIKEVQDQLDNKIEKQRNTL